MIVLDLEPGEVEIPTSIVDLARFREWLHSSSFPQTGRIDWLHGCLEVDMAPEDLETHGGPKSSVATELALLVQKTRLGRVYIDRARLTCPGADLSAEPDILVVLVETLRSGRARLVPRTGGEPGRYLEVEGAADLVVECVSDSSIRKDTVRLRALYHRAGVREYWIVDARREPVRFEVLVNQPQGFVAASLDEDGFQHSEVLQRAVRLTVAAKEEGLVFHQLDVRHLPHE